MKKFILPIVLFILSGVAAYLTSITNSTGIQAWAGGVCFVSFFGSVVILGKVVIDNMF